MTISFLLMSFLGGYSFVYAQTFKDELQSVYASYRTTDKFQTDITITVYNFEDQPVVQKAQIKKSGNNYHYFIDARKVLMNNKYMLTIDENQKEIVVANSLSKEALSSSIFGEEELIGLLKNLDTIIDNGLINGNHNYTILSKENIIEKMDLSINVKHHMLSEVIYYYNSEAGLSATKVVISYGNISTSPSFSSSEFREKQYIEKYKGSFIPSTSYKGYEIIEITQDDLNN